VTSLRARLVLGAVLVAIAPVALAVTVLGARLESTVRRQAGERLAAALDVLEAQLRAEGAQVTAKLELLAADAELKRALLLDAGDAGLREHVAVQQYLVGLDYLGVTDTAGAIVAEAATAPNARARPGREPVLLGALPSASDSLASLAQPRALLLDAAAPIRYRDEVVGRVRGGVVLDSLRLAALSATSGVELVMLDAHGARIAGTTAAAAPPAPGDGATVRVRDGRRAWFAQQRSLAPGAGAPVTFAAFVSAAPTDDALAALRVSSLLLGLAAAATAVALSVLWSRSVSRPVERLAAFSQRIARGEWDEPLAVESVREMQALVDALERMRGDLRDYRERLVASERQAAYGQMARKVAHEIKNPLTPIAVSVADLKRSYEQGREDFPEILSQAVRTIDEEVQSLKRLLQEFSEFGRFPPPRLVPCDARDALRDVASLHARERGEGRLVMEAPAAALPVMADRAQLKQALLNLVQNALDATAAGGIVRLSARAADGRAELIVCDDGPGMSAEQRAGLFVPGFTTKAHGSGLGLTIVERIATDHGGTVAVESAPGRGTTFTLRLPLTRGA
jgi:signal transduction histidine kinase